jgi:putative aldouronate transport system permease protein
MRPNTSIGSLIGRDARGSAQVFLRSFERERPWLKIKRGWQLYLLLFLPLVWLFVFRYYPMYGAQIAFRDYIPGQDIWASPWEGLDNFQRFFDSPMFLRLITNTLGLSLYSLLVGLPIPILFALSLNQLRVGRFKQTVQMVSYAPHFISTVVMVGLILEFLDLRHGPINLALQALGIQPLLFLGMPELFPSVYVWSGIWQSTGFNTIIYLAVLSTIDPALHEAAVVDGANRLQRIWHIDLPGILPTVAILTILQIGNLLNIGFEKIFLLQNPLNLSASEVISTYVYKIGIASGLVNFSYAAAIGLFNSVVGMTLLVCANWLSKRLTESSLF